MQQAKKCTRYDTTALRDYLNDTGIRLNFIAEKLGIKYPTFYQKYMGVNRFTAPEAVKLCTLVGIPLIDIPKYFE